MGNLPILPEKCPRQAGNTWADAPTTGPATHGAQHKAKDGFRRRKCVTPAATAA
jgi:hypothetical protein